MIRLADTLLIAVAAAGAIWTYQIKHEADLSSKKLNTLHAQIAAQNRKIALLEADWALETAPERLEKIAEEYQEQLGLRPMESSQIIDTSELPGLRVDRDDEGQEVYADRPGGTITGGIGELIEQKDDR